MLSKDDPTADEKRDGGVSKFKLTFRTMIENVRYAYQKENEKKKNESSDTAADSGDKVVYNPKSDADGESDSNDNQESESLEKVPRFLPSINRVAV